MRCSVSLNSRHSQLAVEREKKKLSMTFIALLLTLKSFTLPIKLLSFWHPHRSRHGVHACTRLHSLPVFVEVKHLPINVASFSKDTDWSCHILRGCKKKTNNIQMGAFQDLRELRLEFSATRLPCEVTFFLTAIQRKHTLGANPGRARALPGSRRFISEALLNENTSTLLLWCQQLRHSAAKNYFNSSMMALPENC